MTVYVVYNHKRLLVRILFLSIPPSFSVNLGECDFDLRNDSVSTMTVYTILRKDFTTLTKLFRISISLKMLRLPIIKVYVILNVDRYGENYVF